MLAAKNDCNLGKVIQHLQCGQDVEESCFEDALEIAVGRNNHQAVGYLVIHGARSVELCLSAALLKPSLYKTAVLLLLCIAAKNGDKEIINAICKTEKNEWYPDGNKVMLTSKFLPSEWNKSLTWERLIEMR